MTANAESGATGAYQPAEGGSELVRVLDQYLADLQAGRAPDRAQLLAAHPDLASQLEQCLAGIEFIHQTAQPTAETPAQLGDFRIIREVGRGGMGVVYEAEQLSLKRKVALKVLRFGAVADAEVMQRFQREAETVARLHHTNIVPVFAVGDENGVHYYAMQFIAGRSLAAVLEESQAQGTPLEPQEIARWGLQAAEALAHAHQRGVIHRDIKPSNLLLDPEGVVWLTDFGLARRVDEVVLTAAGVLVGTPRYMSPEQAAAAKQPVDHRTDIYSLGATLYELATAKPVFDADTPQGVLSQIQNTEPVAPRQVRGNLPRDLETIILKCLAKEPERRYATAQALADDLRDFLNGRAIKARRPSLAERMMRWAKKQRRSVSVAAAAAIISALLVVGTAVAWNWYADWQLVHVSLTTDGPHLKAEVWDEEEKSLVARFTVPTQEPHPLPPGAFQVRLERDGQLSETFRLFTGPHEEFYGQVGLSDRQLWELSVGPGESYYIANRNGKADLILLSGTDGLRRLDGATGKVIWSHDPAELIPENRIPYPDPELKQSAPNVLRTSYIGNPWVAPGLIQPARDLDDDGVADLVWASRTTTSLLAISGATGKALWWYVAQPALPAGVKEDQVRKRREALFPPQKVIGQPLMVDLDDKPLVVAVFSSRGEQIYLKQDHRHIVSQPQMWIEAVWAKTGKPLWRYEWGVPPNLDFNPSKEASYAAALTQFNGRAIVVFIIDSRLVGLDLRSGKEVWPAHDLGFEPIRAPQFADLEGSGRPDALVLEKPHQGHGRILQTEYINGRVHAKREDDGEILEVLSLADRRPLWATSPRRIPPPGYGVPYQKPLVECLQPGGQSEIITLDREAGQKEWTTLEVSQRPGLDNISWHYHRTGSAILEVRTAKTGEVRWSRRLEFLNQVQLNNQSGRVIIGPDLDGDGYREVFVATLVRMQDNADGKPYLFVDALSGKDGHTLWWSKTPIPYSGGHAYIGSPRWWQSGPDGWPLLVVPVLPPLGGPEKGQTYLFASSTGRLEATVPQSGEPHVADFNGDGLPDLLLSPPPNGQGATNGGDLRVLHGAPPAAWRLLAKSWKPAQDFDGDGIPDLFSSLDSRRTTILSGRDGHRLWQADIGWGAKATSPLPDGDLDGDGTPDAFLVERGSGAFLHALSLHAISGKTGRRLWTAGIEVGSDKRTDVVNERMPYLHCHDLTGKGRPDVLWAYVVENANDSSIQQLWLARVSGRDGKLIWNQPLHDAGNLNLGGIAELQPALVDVDGDGVLDMVLWVPVGDKQGSWHHCGWEVRALSGRDGRLLWRCPLVPPNLVGPRTTSSPWQRPLVAPMTDNGMLEIVATAFRQSKENRKASLEVAVLDAKNGETKWTWRGDDATRIELGSAWRDSTPQLVRLEQGRAFCMSIHDENLIKVDPKMGRRAGSASQLVLLDAARGHVLQRRDVHPQYSGSDRLRFWVYALEGNGRDEVVFIDQGKVWATAGGIDKAKWTWPLGSQSGEILEILPAGKDYPATVVVKAGSSVYGLAGSTGLPRWRCEVDSPQSPPKLLASTQSQGLPRVVFQGASSTVIGRMALPVGADGKYQLPAPTPQAYGPPPEDPRLTRALPWAVWRDRRIWLSNWTAIIGLFGGLVFPGLLLRGTIRRRSWKLGLLAVVVLGTTLGGLYFLFDGSALVGALLNGLVFGLPLFFFLRFLIRWTVGRRWRYLGYLLLLLVLVTLTYAILTWQHDAQYLEAAEHYSWNDWYAVFLPGAYFTGVVILAGLVLGTVGRLLWRGVRKMFPQPRAA